MTETQTGDPPTQRVAAHDDAGDLDAFVADAPVALVEFYTNGCGLCESMDPVLSNLTRALDDLAVATVNPRDDPPLIERFDVRSVPLLVLFVDGEPVARIADGFVGGDELTAWVREHAPAGAL
ncbi:hypothetical protein JCM17823_29380 [Halorubrum gandharaense]